MKIAISICLGIVIGLSIAGYLIPECPKCPPQQNKCVKGWVNNEQRR